MKVGLASGVFGNFQGGAEAVVEALAQQCVRHGHEVFVIASNPSGAFRSGVKVKHLQTGIKLYLLPMRNLYWAGDASPHSTPAKATWHLLDLWNFGLLFSIVRILRTENPEIVNCHNLAGISTVLISVARRLRIPVIQTIHDYSFLSPRATLFPPADSVCNANFVPCFVYRRLKRFLSRNVNGAVFPSHAVMHKFEEEKFFRGALKRVIPNPCLAQANSQKAYSKVMNQTPIFLFMGQLEHHKGIEVLLDVFMSFGEQRGMLLYIAGRGRLEKLVVQACRRSQSIRYLGFVAGEEKQKLLQNVDILVVPSLWEEPFGIVIVEAYEHGLPVIASRVGGIPELVSDGETGLLVEPGDSEQLYKAMDSVVRDPSRWTAMHNKILTEDISVFGGERYYNNFLRLCGEVLVAQRQTV